MAVTALGGAIGVADRIWTCLRDLGADRVSTSDERRFGRAGSWRFVGGGNHQRTLACMARRETRSDRERCERNAAVNRKPCRRQKSRLADTRSSAMLRATSLRFTIHDLRSIHCSRFAVYWLPMRIDDIANPRLMAFRHAAREQAALVADDPGVSVGVTTVDLHGVDHSGAEQSLCRSRSKRSDSNAICGHEVRAQLWATSPARKNSTART